MKIIGIIAFLSSFTAIAQNCSEYIEKNENNFLGKSVKTNQIFLGKKTGTIRLELFMKKLNIEYSSNNEDLMNPKFELAFLLDNNDTLVISSNMYGDQNSVYDKQPFSYKNDFDINLGTINSLKLQLITGVCESGANEFTEVKEKDALKIKELATCFHSSFDEKKDILLSYTVLPESKCGFHAYEIDPITDKLNKRLNYFRVAYRNKASKHGNALVVSPHSKDSVKMIDIKLNGSDYCLNSESHVIFKLENGDKVQFNNKGKIDCGKASNLISFLEDEKISQLLASPISFIRLYTADGYIDIDVISEPNYFIENLRCLDE